MISIVVPIYNKKNTLESCIKSIINQTYKNIEIILVDDGSQDISLEICRKYEKIDNRIKVISQRNGGVSSARNLGIKNAKGKYLQFVDADDTINTNMCEILINTIKKDETEMVICGYNNIRQGKIISKKCINKVTSSINEISESFNYLYLNNFINTPWNKLYINNLIDFTFCEELSIGEDILFNLQYINKINKITFIENPLYNYNESYEYSLTSRHRDNALEIDIKVYKEIKKFINNKLLNTCNLNGANSLFMLGVFKMIEELINYPNLSNKEKEEKISEWIYNDYVENISINTKFNKLHHSLMNKIISRKMLKEIIALIKFKGKILRLKSLILGRA